MFTGIIQETGKILRAVNASHKNLFSIGCKSLQKDLSKGASVSCNGICLTVTDFDDSSITLEVMAETKSRTTVKYWRTGELLNLERSLRMDSFLDGHLVQGHIDCVSRVLRTTMKDNTLYLHIELPEEFSHLLVEKGSIAINGVSLTLFDLQSRSFSVALVDFTKSHTNLSLLKQSDRVNLEFDVIGKYLHRFSGNHKSALKNRLIPDEY